LLAFEMGGVASSVVERVVDDLTTARGNYARSARFHRLLPGISPAACDNKVNPTPVSRTRQARCTQCSWLLLATAVMVALACIIAR
jgi:hypothetical protein